MSVQPEPARAELILQQIGAKPRSIIKFFDDETEAENIRVLDSFVASLENIFLGLEASERIIYTNTALSPEGKDLQLAPLHRKVNLQLEDVAKRASNLIIDHHRKCIKVFEITPASFPGDATVIELRAREVRDYYRTLEMPTQIELLFNSNDSFLIYSLESAPVCLGLVDEELLERARLARIQRLQAPALLALEDERSMLHQLKAIIGNIHQVLHWVVLQPLPLLSDTVVPEMVTE